MSLCKCQQPLPCLVHCTRVEDVDLEGSGYPSKRAQGWRWLFETATDGTLITLFNIKNCDKGKETRWCADSDGSEGLERVQHWMLVRAGLTY